MKMTALLQVALLLGTVSVLASCNGKDPTERTSNPIKNYNGLSQDVPAGQPQSKLPPVRDDGTPIRCQKPYDMSILDGASAAPVSSMQFIVGEERFFHVHIESAFHPYKVEIANRPEGMTLQSIGDDDYTLSWKPKSEQGNLARDIQIVYSAAKSRCLKGVVPETISISVNVNSAQPAITVTGLDDPMHKYTPTDVIPFQVQVVDPSAASGSAAQALQFEFPSQNDTGDGEVKYVNAQAGVKCSDGVPGSAPQTFNYSCGFDFSKLSAPGDSVPTPHLTAFSVFVRSARGEASVKFPKQAIVLFPASNVADASPSAPTDADPKPTQPIPKQKPVKKAGAKK
jgi:hypothetical protein